MPDDTATDAQEWLDRIERAEAVMEPWQAACDNIDKAYADLAALRQMGRDPELQIFWSNVQVLNPAIYSRPPQPVVTPKFKDRNPVNRVASELLERCAIISFDRSDIDQQMIALRDDLSLTGRGAAWVSYVDEGEERVEFEALDRRDFLHDPARRWAEVDWVARRAWLTHEEMRARFGDAADQVAYETKQPGQRYAAVRTYEKAAVWEIWCRSENKVVWVAPGFQDILDEREPYLKLDGFFPCPRPAYSTLQRGTLIPVPDVLIYKDQMDEINNLTRRISAISDAIKVRGFYAAGTDRGAAIETAILSNDEGQLLVPVPNMQSLVAGAGGEPIIWLPTDMLAQTVAGLVELRRQLIDDVYQIIGLSDIMRGSTVASETATAQEIKQQNGSYRVRDKQNELVRVALDFVRIGAEIMAEEFDQATLLEMSQIDLPTKKDIAKQVKDLEAAGKDALARLEDEARRMAQQAQASGQQPDPDEMRAQLEQQQREMLEPIEAQLQQARDAVTVEAVMALLRDSKLRPFHLSIETDSTIYPDEMAEKSARVEFLGAFQSAIGVVMQAAQMGPEAVALAGGVFKFALAPYRVGRELEGMIDDLVDSAPQIAERMAAQSGEDDGMSELAQAEMAKAQAQTMKVEADAQLKMQELQIRAQQDQAKQAHDQQRFALEVQETQGKIAKDAAAVEKIYAEMQLALARLGLERREADREDVKTVADIQSRAAAQATIPQV